MALAETARMAVRIDLEGNASAGIGKLNRQIGGLGSSVARVGKGVGQVGAGIAKAGLVAGAALATGLATAAKLGADFEAQLNTINTIAQVTPDRLKAIGGGIRQLARDNGQSLDDLTKAYYDLLSAGVKVDDAQGVLNQALQLSVGTLGTTSQAVDVLTTAMNAYRLKGSDAARVSEELAVAVRDGKVTLDQIAPTYANVAAIAAQAGVGTDEIAAAFGRLTAQGVPAAEVTTQMSRAIIELLKPNKQLNKLQAETGKNFAKIAKEKGLVVALQEMRDAAKEAGVPFIDLFGRMEGYKFALQTTGKNNKAFVDELDAVHKAAGVLSSQVGERQKGLAFQFGRLSAFAKDAALTLSEGFLPALTRSADKLAHFLGQAENQNALKAIGEDIGKAIDGIDWDAVLRDAREFVGILKSALSILLQVVKAVNGLPTEIKAAAAAFLIANKASGGLIGQGVGNIVGGVGQSVVRGLGSKVPGVGSLFAQPVFVTNWPAGGLAGGAASAGGASVASKVAIGATIVGGLALSAESINELAQKNAEYASKGLNPAETAAIRYYQASAADQSFMAKHLGRVPTKADYDSALAKLAGSSRKDKDDIIQTTRQSSSTATAKAEAAKAAVTAVQQSVDRDRADTVARLGSVRSQTAQSGSSIVSAIYANRPIINVSVSSTSITKVTEVNSRYGSTNGSRNKNQGGGSKKL